nr:HNH endonuclease signature motif containing protein [Gordonia sp. SID5947]
MAVAESHERAYRRMSGVGHRRVMDVSDRGLVGALGYRGLADLMSHRLRIPDARRRMRHMRMLAQMHSLQGELLPPRYAHLAAAVADGAAAPAHVDSVLDTLAKIPNRVPADVQDAAEAMMADFARELTPKQLTTVGIELLARIDPDGALTDDADRKRRRKLQLGNQDVQSMSDLSAVLSPKARALLEVALAAWAAPGMNNPDDENSPAGGQGDADIEQLKEAADRDSRTQGQRNHDALEALLDAVVNQGALGKSHRGFPPHLIIKISESELRALAGLGATATGSRLPIKDVVELAARAHSHLAVFKDHTAQPLYLGTSKRFANRAQRLALFAQPGGGGCSTPGCTQPSAHVEVHHSERDWADGGLTDIDKMGPACPRHNRMVGPKPGQWTTSIIREGPDAGRTGWSLNPRIGPPPPPRVNRAHEVGELLEHYLRRGSIGDAPQPKSSVMPSRTTATAARTLSRTRRRRVRRTRRIGPKSGGLSRLGPRVR